MSEGQEKFRVKMTPEVKRKIEELPPEDRERVLRGIRRLGENPYIGKMIVEETEIFSKNRPKFCPNCGAKIKDYQAEVDVIRKEGGFDCLCKKCGWSGEINPDSLTDLEGAPNSH